MKKSIAVLSLTIAGALGLAACGGNSGGSTSSPSASASASASATASATASAPASTSAATSKSTTSAAAETTKAETKTTQGTISAPSGLPSEATEALKKGQESAEQAASAGYTASKKALEQLKSESGVKKVQTSDGTVYYTDKLAVFESKDGAIVSIQNNGVWTSMDSNGTSIVVKEDGSWIKTNPKDNLYTVVNADGTASVLNTKTFEKATDVSTIETPKAPGRIDGFSGTAKTPVKPTKIGDLSEVAGAK
ncbi:preprotein translocase subunit SecD [uncultured Rothia sp.]|uniref:preprotein translocase subunit SecD n=1 Tax=uncultured Rothia sp. TaxID=316088 RepID=UPI0028896530|nr:preprotein translocase subunit SecD [uncultured Rothia sp.]